MQQSSAEDESLKKQYERLRIQNGSQKVKSEKTEYRRQRDAE